MEKGIKELQELIAAVKELAILGKLVMKDGKVDLNDLALLGKLLEKQAAIVDGFTGLSELQDELKNINLDEALEVVTALVNAAKEVKAS